uniref:SSD domain-containing protein n=1 Tax=Brugia timori TaxID=42155 RepID=A0A0R3Q905_9BILA
LVSTVFVYAFSSLSTFAIFRNSRCFQVLYGLFFF